MTILRRTIKTDLGDTVHTRLEFSASGKIAREDVTLTGPPELVEYSRGGNMGKDIYQREAWPEREIWLSQPRDVWGR
jgi:hypothetical protein